MHNLFRDLFMTGERVVLPGAKGFSPRNLKYMRAFAEVHAGLRRDLAGRRNCASAACNVVAEYALRGYSAPIGVAKLKTAITQSLPAELETSLRTVEEIEAELNTPTRDGDPP